MDRLEGESWPEEMEELLSNKTILVGRAVSNVDTYHGNETLICSVDSMMGCKQC